MRRSADRTALPRSAARFAVRILAIAGSILGSACSPPAATAPSGPPQRIVALGQTGCYETLLDFGVEDRIVAVTKLCHYPGSESKFHVPTDGEGVPSVEAIAALSPDLVVVTDVVRPRIEAAGMRAIGVPRADTHASVVAFVEELGVVLGQPARAKEILDRMDRDLAALRARTAALPKRRVYFEHPGPYRTKGRPTMMHEMIDACGGVNIGAEIEIPDPTVNAEFVVERDPEVIVLGAFTDSPEAAARRPGWSSITAIREGRVFQIQPDDRLLWSSRWIERAERLLLPWIHPEIAAEETAVPGHTDPVRTSDR